MRSSNKSRNRGKNTNRRGYNGGSIINRVFESAGPDGKVRGTPQQIIDKYISLAHDSQLSGDRVSAENFQQHAEHYSRILSEAQKELAEKNIDGLNINLNNNRNENTNNTTNTSFVDNDNKLVQKNKTSIISEDLVNEKNPNEVCSPSDDLVEKSKQEISKSKKDTSSPKNKSDDNRIISEI